MGKSQREIGDGAWDGCAALGEVVFGDAVRAVGARVFARCPKAKWPVMCPGVKTLGSDWSAACAGLEELTVRCADMSLGRPAFD
jgi:hypothetical protein